MYSTVVFVKAVVVCVCVCVWCVCVCVCVCFTEDLKTYPICHRGVSRRGGIHFVGGKSDFSSLCLFGGGGETFDQNLFQLC